MEAPATTGEAYPARDRTFLTNHAHVLLAIARDPNVRLRDVAQTVGITERAAQAIVADLEAGGYLRRDRVGRRNQYTVNPAGRFRHPAEADHSIGDLLDLFTGAPRAPVDASGTGGA
ncbi:MarR family transcriptional regulator [Actinoplanes sichuanensis]|uniref:Helix-turn-helix transcriptional regulator n=1 Tax=Actinoplanes sichuanensis TaxID=512349 RepID=A0ABW4A1Z9_9ACTN|nr:helix-turn-helix domain-containing protein [Actinoplanes sichuanensis]BEL13000.1 MarR family transcriptional regulator [Actinoplanes sichuanensis]